MNILRVGSITAGGNIILVTTDSGATVYAVSGGKVVSGVAVGGVAKLKVKAGTWRVWAELDGQQTSEVEVIVTDSYYKEMSFGMPLSSLAHGALVRLTENGKGVNFYLAKHDYESGLNGAGRSLLVRNGHCGTGQWNTSTSNTNYANSVIDTWFNNTYKAMLEPAVQELIGTTTFYYTTKAVNGSTSTLSRGIFTLSTMEFNDNYSHYFSEGSPLSIATTLISSLTAEIWLRTPSKTDSGYAGWRSKKSVGISPVTSNKAYYPCFTLPKTAMVNPTPNADGSYTLMV